MSEAEREDDFALAPDATTLLDRAQAAWLEPARSRLAWQQGQGKLPHGLLFTGTPGAGQPELGAWLAARLFCRGEGARPCRACADCRLFMAGNHPDYRWIGILHDKKEIGIDQVRVLCEAMSLKSYRGGAKVTVIWPADLMNAHSCNALLKTLEEPRDDTYLVLAANRIDRLPKTVMSRCMRVGLRLPREAEALAWLENWEPRQEWPALLSLAGGAPFLAQEYAVAGLGELDSEMQEAIAAAFEGRMDIVAFAETSARKAPAARLAWLESWLTRSLKEAALASDLVNNNRLPWLRPPGRDTKIRAGYVLLDRLRDARRQVGGPLNLQLLFEGVSASLAALVGRNARESGEITG